MSLHSSGDLHDQSSLSDLRPVELLLVVVECSEDSGRPVAAEQGIAGAPDTIPCVGHYPTKVEFVSRRKNAIRAAT